MIRTEILAISDKYSDERRTQIGYDEFDMTTEDLIPENDIVITMTNKGYVKRMVSDTFKAQNRGGRGIIGTTMLEEDYIKDLFMASTHDYIMFFTNTGRVYRLKGYEIPEAGRNSRGTAIINLLNLQPEESVTAVIPFKDYEDDKYLIMATKKGTVKKTPMAEYKNVRKTGLAAISLREDDDLISVKYTDGERDVFLVTKYGKCIRFNEKDARKTGRTSMGVRGINLENDDEVIGMQVDLEGKDLLFVSEKGIGKRTSIDEFSTQNRGGKGVKCYKIVDKTGPLAGVLSVNDDDEIMIINSDGIIIRMKVDDISVLGRITSGVKVINMEEGITVASIAKVVEKVEHSDADEEIVLEESEIDVDSKESDEKDQAE